jgi:hypothetical protein
MLRGFSKTRKEKRRTMRHWTKKKPKRFFRPTKRRKATAPKLGSPDQPIEVSFETSFEEDPPLELAETVPPPPFGEAMLAMFVTGFAFGIVTLFIALHYNDASRARASQRGARPVLELTAPPPLDPVLDITRMDDEPVILVPLSASEPASMPARCPRQRNSRDIRLDLFPPPGLVPCD